MRTLANRVQIRWNVTASKKLIAEIGLGNAGLVVSLDASRLARRDWHQLLELCSVSAGLS
jgi:hypothetical protein